MGRVLSKFVCIFGCISLRFSLHLYFVFRIFFLAHFSKYCLFLFDSLLFGFH